MNTQLLSFHGKQEIKDAKIAQIKEHIRLDQLDQGLYWNKTEKKGCAVTCTMYSPEDFKTGNVFRDNIHKKYETELGIPEQLAYLEDRIFEGLFVKDSQNWPLDFIEAIPIGVDLNPVWHKLMIWILTDDRYGVIQHAKNKKIVQDIADAYSRFNEVSEREWEALRKVATTATYTYAASASAAAAAYANAHAYAHAYANAHAYASKYYWKAIAEKFLELLKQA